MREDVNTVVASFVPMGPKVKQAVPMGLSANDRYEMSALSDELAKLTKEMKRGQVVNISLPTGVTFLLSLIAGSRFCLVIILARHWPA